MRLARAAVFLFALALAAAPARADDSRASKAVPASASAQSEKPPGTIEFDGRNSFKTVHHVFERWRFTRVEIDRAHPEKSVIELEIDAASIETGDEEMNRRACSKTFFHTAKHPAARIAIREAAPARNGDASGQKFRGKIDLELRGVKRTQDLEFELLGPDRRDVRGSVRLSRRAFKIGRPYIPFNPFSIRDQIEVKFEARLPEAPSRGENRPSKFEN